MLREAEKLANKKADYPTELKDIIENLAKNLKLKPTYNFFLLKWIKANRLPEGFKWIEDTSHYTAYGVEAELEDVKSGQIYKISITSRGGK